MDTGSDARPTTGTDAVQGGRLRSVAMIVIFDVAGPLVAYYLLRSAGVTAVAALLLSGVFPALGVAIGVIRHRRLDVVGALVLAGIVVGTVLGLLSHSARLVLVEGSVPTAAFLLEAALRAIVAYNASAGTALAISKVTPFVFLASLSAWTVAYGAHHRKKGERMAAASGAAKEASHAQPPSQEITRAADQ